MAISDAEYVAWALDPAMRPYRQLLIELDHGSGTIRLGSPAATRSGVPYDNAIIGRPIIEETLSGARSVGDIDATNVDPNVDWLTLDWRGGECRWRFGDRRWILSDFRRIATSLIGGCMHVGEDHYRFQLVGGGRRASRVIRAYGGSNDYNMRGAASDVITHLLLGFGSPTLVFTDVSAGDQAQLVMVSRTGEPTYADLISEVTRGLNAEWRINRDEEFEVLRPSSTATMTVAEGDMVKSGTRMSEIVPPYANIALTYPDLDSGHASYPNSVSTSGSSTIHIGGTGAPASIEATARSTGTSGELIDDIGYTVALTDASDVSDLLDDLEAVYASGHNVWSLQLTDAATALQVGDRLDATFHGRDISGIVQRIRRSPLGNASTVVVKE